MNTIENFAYRNPFQLGISIYVTMIILLIIFDTISFFYRKIHKKSPSAESQQIDFWARSNLFAFIVCQIFSFIFFCISTIWVEYPLFKGVEIWYKNDQNQWVKTTERLLHKPFGFNGYKLHENKEGWITLEPFMVHYSIKEEDVPYVLDNVEDFGNTQLIKFIGKKSKELFFKHSAKELSDEEKRLEIFKSHYKPYGITIERVEFQ